MISQTFINRPKLAFVISIAFIIAGIMAISKLPVAQYPQIAPPQVVIYTNYPGGDSQLSKNLKNY